MLSEMVAVAASRARALPGGREATPLLACLLVVGLAACSEEAERDPLPDWVEGQETVGDEDDDEVVIPPGMGTFTLSAPSREEIGWDIKIHAAGDFDAPCSIDVPEDYRSRVELECILEIPELALFGGGLDFDLAVAPSQCAFLTWHHYMYQAWPIGQGPATVTVTRRGDGVIVDEVNALNGVPKCDYDHSWTHQDGPNCCTGTYEYSVVSASNPDEYLVHPEMRFWGDTLSDCFNGAAYLDPELSTNDDGWPLGKIVHIERTGFQKRFHWDNLSARGYISNVPFASYYDPANHDGTRPAGLNHPYSLPYHLFQCWDEAEENLATVKLVVREWNSMEEFEKGAEGDPHVQGTEPNGDPIDDRADWGVATPGSVMFIMDQQ